MSTDEGSVVLFVRTLDPTALPDARDVAGVTDEDLFALRALKTWAVLAVAHAEQARHRHAA